MSNYLFQIKLTLIEFITKFFLIAKISTISCRILLYKAMRAYTQTKTPYSWHLWQCGTCLPAKHTEYSYYVVLFVDMLPFIPICVFTSHVCAHVNGNMCLRRKKLFISGCAKLLSFITCRFFYLISFHAATNTNETQPATSHIHIW